MKKPIEGQPAFPNPCNGLESSVPGLSERRYYIAAVLQGLCANPNTTREYSHDAIAAMAIQQADELMAMLYPDE